MFNHEQSPQLSGNHVLDVARNVLLLEERNFQPLPLDVCLFLFQSHQCSDPRDKAYGMLSLGNEKHQVVIDYYSSIQEVFSQAVRTLHTG